MNVELMYHFSAKIKISTVLHISNLVYCFFEIQCLELVHYSEKSKFSIILTD